MKRFDEAVEVLCEAFYDYPVMRHLLSDAGDDYERQLRLLVGYFTRSRHLSGDSVWAVQGGHRILGVANIVRPNSTRAPELDRYREALWNELGQAARRKYDDFSAATAAFNPLDPHFHLSMIGVRRAYAGRGIGRCLLEALHELSAADPLSTGVSLTTEDPGNVPLYERFGYGIVGQTTIGSLESWSFFRTD